MGDSTECPICFDTFDAYGKSRPNSCTHWFHTTCLKKWTRTTSSCPSCRQEVSNIHTVYKNKHGIEKVKIEEVKPAHRQEADQDMNDNHDWLCHICFSEYPGDEARTLICEGCDYGFHMDCLNPPLQTVPDGDWFCPQCTLIRHPRVYIESGPGQCTYCFSSQNLEDGHRCSHCDKRFHPSCVPQRVQEVMNNHDEWLCNYCFYLYDPAVHEELLYPTAPRTSPQRANTVRGRRRLQRRHDFIDSNSDAEPDEVKREDSDEEESEMDSEDGGSPQFGRMDSMVLNDDQIYGGQLPQVRRRNRVPRVNQTKSPKKHGKRNRRLRSTRKRNRRVERDETSSPTKSKYPRQQARLGITSGFADIGDLDVEHGEGPSSSAPRSSSNSFDLLGGILQEQEKVLAPGNLFDQRNGQFVAKEKEFEEYRNQVKSKKPVSKVRPWPSSSRVSKPASASRPSFENRPRDRNDERNPANGSRRPPKPRKVFPDKDGRYIQFIASLNQDNSKKNGGAYYQVNNGFDAPSTSGPRRTANSMKSAQESWLSSSESSNQPPGTRTTTNSMKSAQESLSSSSESSKQSPATRTTGKSMQAARESWSSSSDSSNQPPGTRTTTNSMKSAQESLSSSSESSKQSPATRTTKKSMQAAMDSWASLSRLSEPPSTSRQHYVPIEGINMITHHPSSNSQNCLDKRSNVEQGLHCDAPRNAQQSHPNLLSTTEQLSKNNDDDVVFIGAKNKSKKNSKSSISVKTEDIEASSASITNSHNYQGNHTNLSQPNKSNQNVQQDTPGSSNLMRQNMSTSASNNAGGRIEKSSISNNTITNDGEFMPLEICINFNSVNPEIGVGHGLTGAGNMPIDMGHQKVKKEENVNPERLIKEEPEIVIEELPSSSKSHSSVGRKSSEHLKRKAQELNQIPIKKEKRTSLDVKIIDQIAKKAFDEAYVKRKIDRETYKSGLREVVKTAYKLKEDEKQVKERAVDYLVLAAKK